MPPVRPSKPIDIEQTPTNASQTPSPFRLPNTPNWRPKNTGSGGPQFASTPRFLLSSGSQSLSQTQTQTQTRNDNDEDDDDIDIDSADANDPPMYCTPVASGVREPARTRTPRGPLNSAQHRGEVIEDSDDGYDGNGNEVNAKTTTTTTAQAQLSLSSNDPIEGSSDPLAEESDPDYDMLFGPGTTSASASSRASKRRRLLLGRDDHSTATDTGAADFAATPAPQRGRASESASASVSVSADPIRSSPPVFDPDPDPNPDSDPPSSSSWNAGLREDVPAPTWLVRPRGQPSNQRLTAEIPSKTNSITFATQTPKNTTTTSSSSTPFSNHHRFKLSETQQQQQRHQSPLPNDSPFPFSNPLTSQTPLPQKQKPTFILPRSPSPDEQSGLDAKLLSTPFSPSSRALHRRGRGRGGGRGKPRTVTPGYVPGGMASEVRSWIVEMGMKRGRESEREFERMDGGGGSGAMGIIQAGFASVSGSGSGSATRPPDMGTEVVGFNTDTNTNRNSRYHTIVRVDNSRPGAHAHSHAHAYSHASESGPGPFPLIFVAGKTDWQRQPNDNKPGHKPRPASKRLLLLGSPSLHRSGQQQETAPRPGSLVGVRRGLVWEVELDVGGFGVVQEAPRESGRVVVRDSEELMGGSRAEGSRENWLVCMEWDILSGDSKYM